MLIPVSRLEGCRADVRVGPVVIEFEKRFLRPPVAVSVAPGRINLIGEHIDYMGYGVLPMAIGRNTAVAYAVSESSEPGLTVKIQNLDSVRYDARTCHFESLDAIRSLKLTKAHHWTNYVLCGLMELSNLPAVGGDSDELLALGSFPQSAELSLLVDGNVPIGKGLSSSSSINCAATLSAVHSGLLCRVASGLGMPSKCYMASLTQRAERFIGMMGGGMDQTISMCAEEGVAKNVEFEPTLTTRSVFLPSSAAFVVADCMVQSNKNETASRNYNCRVVECRLGSAIIGKKRGIPGWESVRSLWSLQQAMKVDKLSDMEQVVSETLPTGPMSLDAVATLLSWPIDRVRKVFFFNSQAGIQIHIDEASEASLRPHDRCLHVFSEARRVQQFCASSSISDPQSPARLGKLMNASHESCRDLYGASCDELEELRGTCLSAPAGSCFGARFTGAGWGGCVVAIVRKSAVEGFVEHVWGEFFEARMKKKGQAEAEPREDVLFRSSPMGGARVDEVGVASASGQ